MSIGENIKKIRTQKKLTIRDLSKLSGVAKSTISDIENDNVSPTAATLEKLAEAFGISVEEFFKSEPDTKEHDTKKITDVKQAMEVILSQPGLMLNGEMLSDESKIALANAIQMGLAYAEQMQKKEKEKNKK